MQAGPGSGVAAPPLLEALPDAVVVADERGRVVYANPAIRSLMGHDPAGLIGEPLTSLMPERLRTAHEAGFARFLATGTGELLGTTTRVPALHVDGTEVPVDLTLSPLTADDGGGFDDGVVVAVLRDARRTVLLEQQLQVSRYLTATLDVTAALTAADDAEVAFERLLPTLCSHLDWDAAALWQVDEQAGQLVHAGTWARPGLDVPSLHRATQDRSFPRGRGLPGLTWQRRAPVVIEDLWEDPCFLRTEAARSDGVRTGVAFPVSSGDRVLAVCELFSREPRPVPPELLDVLAHAGRQIGQFLARLRAESELRRLADTLQRSLLPSHLPTIPGLELAARYRAGAEGTLVGGDTYDVIPLPDGRWLALVADVCGTGAEAAGLTALTRHTARAAAGDGRPSAVLSAINTALLRETGSGPLRFVTACCLVLAAHEDGATVSVSNAGHPRPVLRRPDGECVELDGCGPPLGITPEPAYAEFTVNLCRGNSLVLYTDGVTEARDDSGAQFGDEALLTVLRATAAASADETVAAVSAAVERQLAGSRHGTDDQVILALRA